MIRLVLDCSIAMTWGFEDETHPLADKVLEILDTTGEAVVPSLWYLEIANALLVSERRGRLTLADTRRFLTLLDAVSISVDEEQTSETMVSVMALGREHGVSAYDAAYLELAMREGLPLATLDARMRQTAEKIGITLVQE